jgi:hypothetical protein
MAYQTFTRKTEVVSVDIQTMEGMSLQDYDEYLRNGLFSVDHHDVLREQPAGGYPIAVTQAQMKALLSYLEEIAPKVGNDS